MTRDDLIERIAMRTKLSRTQAENLVFTIFGSIQESLRQGERIEIRGFGTFQVRSYKGYKGRNPRTGIPVEVAPKRLPFFKVSKNLAADVNGGRAQKDEPIHGHDARMGGSRSTCESRSASAALPSGGGAPTDENRVARSVASSATTL